MIFTARQLEDMHKSAGNSGRIVLPYRAKLTPLARDFLRMRKIEVGYSDAVADKTVPNSQDSTSPGLPVVVDHRLLNQLQQSTGQYLWWTDGPNGLAKAAIAAEERQSGLIALQIAHDDAHLISAIRSIAKEIKSQNAIGGVLLVQHAAKANLFANRCPSIRAVLGTCMETVEQGVNQIAANMLIIEYPYKNFSQIRNLLSRFLRAPRTLSPETEQQLRELASCA